MEYAVKKVSCKDEAIAEIKSRKHKIVELNYEGGANHLPELAKLGRKHIVGVLFLAQESITIPDETTLKNYIHQPKQTFKQRFLLLDFPLDSKSFHDYQVILSEHGDLILPQGFNPTIKTVETHQQR